MKIKPSLRDIKSTLTKSPVLLPIPNKEKGPHFLKWEETTYEKTQEPKYQQALERTTNIGVLLGARSSHLCSIDFDNQAALDDFLSSNSILANSLRIQGARGAQIYAYFEGKRPLKMYRLMVAATSPLAAGKEPNAQGLCQIGEFRADGVQSVLVGEHPNSTNDYPVWYTWLIDAPPVTVSFEQIIWNPDIRLPWADEERADLPEQSQEEKSALHMAIEKIDIDFLWNHFRYGPKKGNPVKSPFRNENNPSFSIYLDKNGKQKFKDHGHPEHSGDSFDFFRLAQKLEDPEHSQKAYRLFLELAGMLEPDLELGEELFEETLKASERYGKARIELKPPPIGEDAYVGFIGDLIKYIEPLTECNRDNLLMQFLAVFGVMVGRYRYVYAGRKLFANIFVVILGESALARKGTALDIIQDFTRLFDPEWRGIRGGWASGEALVHHTRDAHGKDEGVHDKRVLVCETELFQIFRVGDRQGNNLIVKMREAWDSPEFMANTSKNTPQIATAPHIGMIGHMTQAELITTDPSNISNGFINRILWTHAFRARLVPNSKPIVWPQELKERFASILAFARGPIDLDVSRIGEPSICHVPLDANAELLWEKIYREAPAAPGAMGAILERFTSQVQKAALEYSMMDRSSVITRTHLLAGLAVAKHSQDCVRLTFSTFTPNKCANKILAALRRRLPEGMSRCEIFEDIFNKHISKEDIVEALTSLKLNGLADVKVFKTGDKGRPKEVWFAFGF